ncbi:hypothetical protein SmJEL517_g01292 [Synchytrium microbalum]|uniref:CN hydrolase domain-containing protein n=1 Tax=Synchytrium microbalum TaxID=1806994 RepID=A0A507CAV4_9FUNG|nr:uncharacterized protein SmJEL517_g01292 [Synchytrium microbalum]TPX36591.1 hypothetical protein SmJEL517_g01292 [Synchytrium microbalum]
MAPKFKIALIQLFVTASKEANIASACQKVLEASRNGAKVVVLPGRSRLIEVWNSPYGTKYFAEYAEKVPGGPSTLALSSMAKDSNCWLIGGSIPESSQTEKGKYYNTCTVYSPKGELAAIHRKVHLFDIDVPGKIKFTESDVLSGGNSLTHFTTEYGKIGVGICYDIRFPELAMIAARKGCVGMVYPGAFNTTTGPLHWELLARARAIDNQFFVACCSPARDPDFSYQAWGHSLVVGPMGDVKISADEKETIIYQDIDLSEMEEARSAIPVTVQRRFDLYNDVSATMSEAKDGRVLKNNL